MPTLNEFRAKVQFVAPLAMPNMLYRAAEKTGAPSITRYIQLVLCAALARDLGLDKQELIDSLPPTKGKAAFLDKRHSQPKRAPSSANGG